MSRGLLIVVIKHVADVADITRTNEYKEINYTHCRGGTVGEEGQLVRTFTTFTTFTTLPKTVLKKMSGPTDIQFGSCGGTSVFFIFRFF